MIFDNFLQPKGAAVPPPVFKLSILNKNLTSTGEMRRFDLLWLPLCSGHQERNRYANPPL